MEIGTVEQAGMNVYGVGGDGKRMQSDVFCCPESSFRSFVEFHVLYF